jgi:hypothetical protein
LENTLKNEGVLAEFIALYVYNPRLSRVIFVKLAEKFQMQEFLDRRSGGIYNGFHAGWLCRPIFL